MKKILFFMALCSVIACGNKKEQQSEAPENAAVEPQKPAYTKHPDYAQGVELTRGSDCATCHSEKVRIQGPTYEEIAAKYEATPANIKMLAGKIIKGSSGTWGETQMTAHPSLSQQNAEALVKFVLLHK
jgi:cytochrome c